MMSTGIVLNSMAGSLQATAPHYPQVLDRSMVQQSVCPMSYLESFSSETQMLPVSFLPLGHSSNQISISVPRLSDNFADHSNEITMIAAIDDLPPSHLLDEAMDDWENTMDVDEVYGGTEQSGTAGAGIFVTLEDVELDNSDRMVVDAGHSSPFDVFVDYFASVMCPGSWMDMDPSECRFQ